MTLRLKRLGGAKESCKIRTKKYYLQFTSSGEIKNLKAILGSSITVSVNNGYPSAPKRIRVVDDYVWTSQTASVSEYVNATLPHDVLQSHRPNGFFFLWCLDTEKLRVTMQWGRYRISHPWVRNKLSGSEAGPNLTGIEYASASEETGAIKIGDDFPHLRAQFEVEGFVGDSHVSCRVIESSNQDYTLGQFLNFSRDLVINRMTENY